MTIAKDFASKFAVAIVAAAMILLAVAPSARAATQTPEELQKTINDLLAQVSALQTQIGGAKTTPAGLACGVFSMNLKKGSNGADVKALQMLLNGDADTMVSMTGAGSKGMETMTFGPATMAAVSKFQVKYRAEVLTPAGLVNPTGFFGPGTRAQANKLCAAGSTGTTTPTPGTTTPGKATLTGEASLQDFKVSSPADDRVQDGASDASIAEVTTRFKDGDGSISRLDVTLDPAGSVKPWDIFDTVSVFVDGKMVGTEVNASNRHDYVDESAGTIRLSGLDIVGMKDKQKEFTIVATLQSGIKTANQVQVVLTVAAVRYFDATGVSTTETTVGDIAGPGTSSFNVEDSGAQDELIAKTSSTDPNSMTIQLKDNKKSGYNDVFVFDLDTKDSVNDITVNTIDVNVLTTVASYNTLVDKAELEIDGTTVDNVTVTGGGVVGNAVLHFDTKGDVTINKGDRVTATLKLRFNSLLLANEGSTIKGSISSLTTTNVDAEGSDSLVNTQLSGSAIGDVHTLRTTGLSTATKSTSAVATEVTSASDYATYTIKVDVTAFNQDVFISTTPATSISYTLENGASVAAVAGTRSVTLSSNADETSAPGYIRIGEGETKTLTLTVTYTPGAINTAARMVLNSISFAATAVAPTKTQTTLPATDYRTDVVTIVS